MGCFNIQRESGGSETITSQFNTKRSDAGTAGYNLFKNPVYSDVKVKCKDRVWNCHRAILCPRCPFFQAALCGDFAESLHGEVELNDEGPQVIDILLEYLYTCERPTFHMLTDVWLLFNVFVAADKYGVTKLMIECRRWINACLAILVGDEKAFSKLEKEGWMMKVGRALWQMDESRTFTVRTTYLWVVQAYLYRIMDLKWMKDLVAEVPEFSIELIRYLGKCCNDPQIAKEE